MKGSFWWSWVFVGPKLINYGMTFCLTQLLFVFQGLQPFARVSVCAYALCAQVAARRS